MAKLKAEFLQYYYDKKNVPLRTWAVAHINLLNKMGSLYPALYNWIISWSPTKKIMGFDSRRKLPPIHPHTCRQWFENMTFSNDRNVGKLYLFMDEFTNFNEIHIGVAAVDLLHRLGYNVALAPHKESGRTFISKGLLRKAQKIANYNVELFSHLITEEIPLVGIEPSCILSFRDEYPELVSQALRKSSEKLSVNTLTIEEFIVREWKQGRINSSQFTDQAMNVVFHGHCQQKSLTTTQATREMLSIPANFSVNELKTGCCGMAGAFGYEKKHYNLSMQIGELALFPQVREIQEETIIAASGTSCRQHIEHGTNRKAKHPIEVLWEALI